MTIVNKTVLVTGASRGIGAALITALLDRGAKRVYAGARNPDSLKGFADPRVIAIKLDITEQADVDAAVKLAGDVDVIINNAGTINYSNVVDSSLDLVGADLETNFYGTLRVLQAFAPTLIAKGGGVIANVISVVGLAAAPAVGGYSVSKAALHSATQSARTLLGKSGVKVLGIYPGPIDTDMARGLDTTKASPESAATRIVEGIEAGDAYIFPDPVADQVGHLWRTNAPALEAVLASI